MNTTGERTLHAVSTIYVFLAASQSMDELAGDDSKFGQTDSRKQIRPGRQRRNCFVWVLSHLNDIVSESEQCSLTYIYIRRICRGK